MTATTVRQPRRYAGAACRRAAERIALSPEGTRHATIRSEARSLFRLERRGLLTGGEIHDLIHGAAQLAGMTDTKEIENAMAEAAALALADAETAMRRRIERLRAKLTEAAAAMPPGDCLRRIIEGALAEAESPGARIRAPAPRDAAPRGMQ